MFWRKGVKAVKEALKKAAVTVGALGTMGVLLVAPAFAQTTTTTSVTGFNPISQWIVLSGLFGGTSPFGTTTTMPAGTTTGTTTTVPTTASGVPLNPISQWIVLSSLFGAPVV